jgi:2-methylaconitate cis-trans-isomerase PrpF
MLDVPGLGQIRVSLIDAANPGVFIAAADIGMVGNEARRSRSNGTAS